MSDQDLAPSPPDRDCITMPDGSCVAPICQLHGPRYACGHDHSDAEWLALEAAYARRAWRAQLIRAILLGEPQTFEVLDLQEVINAYFFPRMAEPDRSRLIADYLTCIQAYLMLDPCRSNVTPFPIPQP